ncbi:MAG: hypothetical protein PHV05_12185 [Candidatus Riflebacteria bacterium]|nr:hypothetical protein [Candidatus Riflebacteria bacterium]
MHKRLHQKSFTGFSFIEILFAIICLGFLIAPIFSIFKQGSAGTVQNRNDILAQQHASNLLSYAYSLPYDHAFLNPGTRTVNNLDVAVNSISLPLTMEESIFNRTISIEEEKPANWPFAYKILTIVVKWKQAQNIEREIKIAGLVAK